MRNKQQKYLLANILSYLSHSGSPRTSYFKNSRTVGTQGGLSQTTKAEDSKTDDKDNSSVVHVTFT